MRKILPILATTIGFLTADPIHLHYNENSWGCFPSVQKAMEEALSASHIYADDLRNVVVQEIATYHGVGRDQVVLTNGLTEMLRLIADAYAGSGKRIVMGLPTYDYYNTFGKNRNIEIVKVPLREGDYAHDLSQMLAEVDETVGLVYLCNPNNPTGSITPREEIDAFLEKLPSHVYVFIDEAYHHFAEGFEGYLSFIEKPSKNPKVIVGRTFSKVYGLAGMRLGYAIAERDVATFLEARGSIYFASNAVLSGALAALRDEEALARSIQVHAEARSAFLQELNKRGLSHIPCYTSFVMMETGGYSVEELIAHFKKHDILIGRKFLDTHVRISFGLPEEMQRFWEVWDLLE